MTRSFVFRAMKPTLDGGGDIFIVEWLTSRGPIEIHQYCFQRQPKIVGGDPLYTMCVRYLSAYMASRTWRARHAFERLQGYSLHSSTPRVQCRYNLNRDERTELARLVREGSAQEIATHLNDTRASSRILDIDGLTSFLEERREEVTYGECGHFHAQDTCGATPGSTVCDDCIEEGDYRIPEDSSYYYRTTDLHYHEGIDAWYTYPESDDDDEDEDEDEDDGTAPMSYTTNVLDVLGRARNTTVSDGPFTIGVELEVYACDRYERGSLIDTVRGQAGTDIICKRDGSLDDYQGVELVTRPMYPADAIELFGRLELPTGTTAWDAGTCGMHVHIDSRAFTKSSIAKFLAFWNDAGNAGLIRRIAGRHPDRDSQAATYAQRVEAPGSSLLQKAKYHAHGDARYRIVNLRNLGNAEAARLELGVDNAYGAYNTVELRIFRATLKKERLLAQIEMATATVYFARDASMNDVSAETFLSWLGKHTALYPHLTSFLSLRRLLKPNPATPRLVDETVS